MGAHISIITRPVSPRVSIVHKGPKGENGATLDFTHTQAVASDTWIINHNFGWHPLVTVLSVGGVEIEANVVHMSANQTRVLFASPQAGSARCV